jgi:hypothetical protein
MMMILSEIANHSHLYVITVEKMHDPQGKHAAMYALWRVGEDGVRAIRQEADFVGMWRRNHYATLLSDVTDAAAALNLSPDDSDNYRRRMRTYRAKMEQFIIATTGQVVK